MKKTALIALVLMLAVSLFAVSAGADELADFDFLTFAKEKVLTDYHPTAKPADATAEYNTEPVKGEDGVVSATVTVFYSGWIKKHQAKYDIDVMPAAGLVRVNVVEDTNGMSKLTSKTFRSDAWVELAGLGYTAEKMADSSTPSEAESQAEEFDFITFAKEKVLPDFHPTAKAEEARAEYDKEPAESNGVLSARVRIWYTSLKTDQDMLVTIEVMPKPGLVKATVVRDSDVTNLMGSKIFTANTWVDLASLNASTAE